MRSSVIQTLTAFAFLAILVKAQVPAYVDRRILLERNWALITTRFPQLQGRAPLGTRSQ